MGGPFPGAAGPCLGGGCRGAKPDFLLGGSASRLPGVTGGAPGALADTRLGSGLSCRTYHWKHVRRASAAIRAPQHSLRTTPAKAGGERTSAVETLGMGGALELLYQATPETSLTPIILLFASASSSFATKEFY